MTSAQHETAQTETAMKDITDVIRERSNFGHDIQQFRKTCLGLPLVKDCDAEITAFKGRQIDTDRFAVDITGAVRITTGMKMGLKLDATGSGEVDSQTRKLVIKDVTIHNDFQGMFGQILSMTGLAAGRSLNLRARDADVIKSALST